MADRPFDLSESFERENFPDATQLAMHGLLSTYFAVGAKSRSSRADQIIAAVFQRRQMRWHSRQRLRSRWWIGLAAAVLLVLAFLQPWKSGGLRQGIAFADALDNVVYAMPLPSTGGLVDPADAAAIAQAEATIRGARAKMDETRDVHGEEGQFMYAWMSLYRNLRNIGRWDEALAEMEAATAFGEDLNTQRREEGEGGWTYFHTCLSDLGNTYAAMGDMERAREYHAESLRVATDYFEWRFSPAGDAPDKSNHVSAGTFATSLGPRHWPLAEVAEFQGDLVTARTQLDIAAGLFRDALIAEGAFRGIALGEDADVSRAADGGQNTGYKAGDALSDYPAACSPSDIAGLAVRLGQLGDPSLRSLIVSARGHLLRETQWLRLSKQPEAAWGLLELAQAIPYSAQHDESRLDFNEPLEALRLSLARRDFEAALVYAREAEERTDGPAFPMEYDLPRPPISLIARAELRFMRAVAEAGRNPIDASATERIRQSISQAREIANSLPPQIRDRYWARLATWNDVLQEISQQHPSPPPGD